MKGIVVVEAIVALAAAAFWIASAIVGWTAPPIDQIQIGLTVNPADAFNHAMTFASELNASAAVCAAVAALLHAVDLIANRTRRVT